MRTEVPAPPLLVNVNVCVEFTARGDVKQDPGLVDRVSAAYDRRMGR